MSPERKAKIDNILEQLEGIAGVCDVQSDDWDSCSINVFVTLSQEETMTNLRGQLVPKKFKRHLRSLKRDLARFGCLLHYPEKQYYTEGGKKYPDGYDCGYVKLEVLC